MTTSFADTTSQTLVHRFKHWAEQQPQMRYMTQPLNDGTVVHWFRVNHLMHLHQPAYLGIMKKFMDKCCAP